MVEALFIYDRDKATKNCDTDKKFLSFYNCALVSDYKSISRVFYK
jgi:hypothetical protein